MRGPLEKVRYAVAGYVPARRVPGVDPRVARGYQ
jgi:hypothetical protein